TASQRVAAVRQTDNPRIGPVHLFSSDHSSRKNGRLFHQPAVFRIEHVIGRDRRIFGQRIQFGQIYRSYVEFHNYLLERATGERRVAPDVVHPFTQTTWLNVCAIWNSVWSSAFWRRQDCRTEPTEGGTPNYKRGRGLFTSRLQATAAADSSAPPICSCNN